jgi:hypothetical protein
MSFAPLLSSNKRSERFKN